MDSVLRSGSGRNEGDGTNSVGGFSTGSLWLTTADAVLILSNGPFEYSPSEIEWRIADRKLESEMQRFPANRASDLAAFFLLGPKGLETWAEGAEIIEDDRPFLEFRAAHWFAQTTVEENFRVILQSVRPHMEDLGDYLIDASPADENQVRAVNQLRDAVVAFRLDEHKDFESHVEVAENLPREARASAVWAPYYRILIEQWARSPQVAEKGPGATQAIFQRAHLFRPPPIH